MTTVGSLTEWLMKRLVAQKGWPKDAVTLVPVGSDLQSQAALLTTGQIDGVVAPPAFGVQLEAGEEGAHPPDRVSISARISSARRSMPPIRSSRAIPTRSGVSSKRGSQNIAWMRAHKPETVELVRKYTHYSPEVESKEYDLVMPIFSPDGKFHPGAMKTLAEILRRDGHVRSSARSGEILYRSLSAEMKGVRAA